MLINKSNYYNFLERLFPDQVKSENVNEELTLGNPEATFRIISIFCFFEVKQLNNKRRKCDINFCRLKGHTILLGYTSNLIHFQVFDQFWIQPTHQII